MDRYRQILEKAIQLSGVEQLEALKAFVEASKCISGVSGCTVSGGHSECGVVCLLALHETVEMQYIFFLLELRHNRKRSPHQHIQE